MCSPVRVTVELDANHSIEVTSEDTVGSEGEDEMEDDIEVCRFICCLAVAEMQS